MKLNIILFLLLVSPLTLCVEKLKYIADFNIETGEKFKETEIGGLSGIVFDSKTKRLFAVSDDRSVTNPARYYQFDLTLKDNSLELKPFDVVFLKNKAGSIFKKHEVRFEGITILGTDLIITSEGAINREPPIPPEIFHFANDGKYIENLPIDEKFLPPTGSMDKKHGAQDNLVFESLSSTLDGKGIFIGTKESLFQDDSLSTPNHASKVRILFYKDLKPTKEYLYQLEKIPNIKVAGLTVGEAGLVDLAAIDENNIYTLERSYLPLAKKNFIKIFKVSGFDKATDISSMDSIKNKDVKLLNKELVLDFETIIPSLNVKYQTIDNIAGLCFGPLLSNGHQTLLVVSNNNFSKKQRTQFIAFEIIP